jgi:hypothetical protein
MRNIYSYEPTWIELITRPVGLTLHRGERVRLARPPRSWGSLNKKFKWIEDMSGNFIGMVTAESLVKVK